MASFHAELQVDGQRYRVVRCLFGCTQDVDARGYTRAKVRHQPLALTLDVPDHDALLAWAQAPNKPLAGRVVFFDAARQVAHETIAFDQGHCVGYHEAFESGADRDGSYVCRLTIAATTFELLDGGPTEAEAAEGALATIAQQAAAAVAGAAAPAAIAGAVAGAGPAAGSGSQYLALAQAAYQVYSRQLPAARQALEEVLGEFGQVQGRAKSPESAANRLQRAVDNGWAQQMATTTDVLDNLWDAVGTRVVLKDSSPATMNRLTTKLVDAINTGKLDVVKIENLYGAQANSPYLSAENTEQLLDDANLVVTQKPYESGYTATTIFVKYPDGVRGEIQLIGEKTVEIANAEHLVYDAFLNKPYLGSYAPAHHAAVAAQVEPIRAGAQALAPPQKAAYMEYLSGSYADARRAESGLSAQPPAFPAEVPAALSVGNLVVVNQQTAPFKLPS